MNKMNNLNLKDIRKALDIVNEFILKASNIYFKSDGSLSEHKDFVVMHVTNRFGITMKEIITGKSCGNRQNAKSVLVYILKNNLGYNVEELSKMVNKSKQNIYNSLNYIERLNINIKNEREVLEKLNDITNLLKTKINK